MTEIDTSFQSLNVHLKSILLTLVTMTTLWKTDRGVNGTRRSKLYRNLTQSKSNFLIYTNCTYLKLYNGGLSVKIVFLGI